VSDRFPGARGGWPEVERLAFLPAKQLLRAVVVSDERWNLLSPSRAA
jgi:hypothetical protein